MENIEESFLGDLIINHTPSNDLLKAAGRTPEIKGFNEEQTLQPFVVKATFHKKNNLALLAVAGIALFLIFKK